MTADPDATASPPAAEIDRHHVFWQRMTDAFAQAPPGGRADALCAAAVEGLTEVDGAVITIRGADFAQHQYAVSSGWARRGEELQLITGEGPSLSAFTVGSPVMMLNTGADAPLWPFFAGVAHRIGVHQAVACPLLAASVAFGTFTLYSRTRALEPHLPMATALAQLATMILLSEGADEIVGRLAAATDESDINVAVGVLVSALATTPGDALARIRATAYANDRRMVDVAREVIARLDQDLTHWP